MLTQTTTLTTEIAILLLGVLGGLAYFTNEYKYIVSGLPVVVYMFSLGGVVMWQLGLITQELVWASIAMNAMALVLMIAMEG